MQTDHFGIFRNQDSDQLLKQAEVPEVAWRSPSNIALVKYWGKKAVQLPSNPSLSITLDKAFTVTRLKAFPSDGRPGISLINGASDHPFLPRLQKLYAWLATEIPFLKEINVEVTTENSFPHSTGIASSASGISAFTLCILSLATRPSSQQELPPSFFRAASFASRMGSGSACRSVYGGFTVWGMTADVAGSSDDEAVQLKNMVHPDFERLQDAILVVSSEPKSLGSSLGHSLMEKHPFAAGRFQQARQHLHLLLQALQSGDFGQLAVIAEAEALSLHALLMTSHESGLLLRPGTLEIISRIRQARRQGLAVFFSLDAGPTVHLLYPEKSLAQIEQFIRQDLLLYCENGKVIFDHCGKGPIQIKALPFNP